jgi:hypothetical protein
MDIDTKRFFVSLNETNLRNIARLIDRDDSAIYREIQANSP